MEDWQKLRIDKNIDKLITQTHCHAQFLSIFRQANILSDSDVEYLRSKSTPTDEADTLYTLLKTRRDAFDVLKKALSATNQSGALDILCKQPTNYTDYGSIAVDKECVIGRGCYNTKVYKGIFGGRDVAVKVINIEDLPTDQVDKEITCLKQLDHHPNIVRYFTAETKKKRVYIALELCRCNLLEWVMGLKTGKISEKEILSQATEGLGHIHANKLIHRDLKPVNILLTDNWRVKISDFGLSKRIPNDVTGVTLHSMGVGTEGWMAPEIYNFGLRGGLQMKLKPATDIFSLGCVFYFTLTSGSHPFGVWWERQTAIIKNQLSLVDATGRVTDECMTLIKRMISRDTEKRPTTAEILSSSFFTTSGQQQPEPKVVLEKETFDVFLKTGGKLPTEEGIGSVQLPEDPVLVAQRSGLVTKARRDERAIHDLDLEIQLTHTARKLYKIQWDMVTRKEKKLKYLPEKELVKMEARIRRDVIKEISSLDKAVGTNLQENVETKLQEMFMKYKERNNLISKSVSKNTKKVAVGIHLGSHNCQMAYFHYQEVGGLFQPEYDFYYIPACVCFTSDGGMILGWQASEKQEKYPTETVVGLKKYIGQAADKTRLPFYIEQNDGKVQFKFHGKQYQSEQILAAIFEHLKKESEKRWELDIAKAVITAPAYFTENHKKSLFEAGQLAGLEVMNVLNEHTAVTLYNELDWEALADPRKCLICHMGGNTFDVTILEVSKDKTDVLGNTVDTNLGGKQFVQGIVNYCVDEIKESVGIDLLQDSETSSSDDWNQNIAKKYMTILWREAKRVKLELDFKELSKIELENLVPGKRTTIYISRETFERINLKPFERAFDIIIKTLETCGIKKEQIQDVVLTGGSTSIMKLQTTLQKYFEGSNFVPKCRSDKVFGAAMQAAILNTKP